jgi:hypothetical protein
MATTQIAPRSPAAPEAAGARPVAADTSAARPLPRWPLVLIALPAAVAVWSGWVGLGTMCGFGIVHPLPGIVGRFTINTAITLPVGVEAYGAYAMGAWLTPGTPQTARDFARRSAIGALGLGMGGQVIYHLLAAARAATAPWPVVMLVACLPVLTLGFGAALTHLLRIGHSQAPDAAVTPDAADLRTEIDSVRSDLRTEVRTEIDSVRAEVRKVISAALPPLPEPPAVDRDALVAELAEQMREAVTSGERWAPDYDALMERTGYRRSWCEKAVRDARAQVLSAPSETRTDAPLVPRLRRVHTDADPYEQDPRTEAAADAPRHVASIAPDRIYRQA